MNQNPNLFLELNYHYSLDLLFPQMAFMNLETMKEHSFMYRMTVNNKMTLSQTDRRVSIASHDSELLLYSFLLRYARMENEMTSQENIIVSTEEFQELQGINVQTKVLVANTLFTVLATVLQCWS